MAEETRIAVVKNIVFYNRENGYTVAHLAGEGEGGTDSFTAVGNLPGARAGMRYELSGEWKVHPQFGAQFSIRSFTEMMPDTDAGIELFLASGAIKGIGPKTARAILSAFGDQALHIIENETDRLKIIPGIGGKKCEMIRESFLEQRELAALTLYFRQYDISPAAAMRLYREYGAGAREAIEENPYRMIDDIFGVGFRTADNIAMKLGVAGNSPDRIASGLLYILRRHVQEGNTYVPKKLLIEGAIQLMDVMSEEIEDQIFSMTLEGRVESRLVNEEEGVFLSPMYFAELDICKDLIRLTHAGLKEIRADADNLIRQPESRFSICLSPGQKDAVRRSLSSGVFVITGGPGTGKTTIMGAILDIFTHCEFETAIAAPTGRAARRIGEATGYHASTIHRLLEYSFTDDREEMVFGRDRHEPLTCDVVIVDEASMIDVYLMRALLAAIPSGTRLIIVGDSDQLPPVGPGNVLRDLIESGQVVTAHLSAIFRQAEESMIVVNAHRVNRGEYPLINEKDADFFMVKRKTEQDILSTLVDLCTRRLPSHFKDLNPATDIQILTPVKKGLLGNANLNRTFQRIFNPPAAGKPEKPHGDRVFRTGDKVMQTKNNYGLSWVNQVSFHEGQGVFNGDMGLIHGIDEDMGRLTVSFDDGRFAEYSFAEMEELEHAWAVTVHKSQGSEFPVVVMPIFPVAPLLATKNLIYTAITRGKRLVALVGSENRLRAMVDNDHHRERYSALRGMLARYEEEVF